MLREAEESGLFAAGFVSYEAAPAFDSALTTHPADGFPLLCLGLFHAPDVLGDIEEAPTSFFEVGELKPSVSKADFVAAIGEIKERIAEGATYQVNYTYRLNAGFSGDAWAFFYELVKGQKTEYAAFVETDEYAICSASPELFFSLNDGQIVSRPMKGTARRGRTFSEDWQQAEALRNSEKDRAENIMIVDMIRNDIGRVAEPGSVETISKYDVEKYPTVWQMTSTVQGKLKPRNTPNTRKFETEGREESKGGICLGDLGGLGVGNIVDVMTALFPCASITGAPKAKTMEIIQGLETAPRKVYTGSIGFMTPRGEACFNVAIRTALIGRKTGLLEFGVGGGIVWDSDSEAEYEETLTKARVLTQPRPDFQLLETMLWEPESGVFLLDEHLQRMGKSAAYFDIPLDAYEIFKALEEHSRIFKDEEMRIRLRVSRDGTFEMESFPMCSNASPTEGRKAFGADGDRFPPVGFPFANPLRQGFAGQEAMVDKRGDDTIPMRVELARESIDSQDVFLFHKTTHRAVYEKAKSDFPDCDDVILWNERGEVTESTIANVVIRKEGKLVTPPVECALLAGTFREHLLKSGEIEEGIILVDDLKVADEVFLVNSVRRWQRADLKQEIQ